MIAAVDGATLAQYCKPWVAVLGHLKGIKSPTQHAIAIDRACWQGEAIAAVVAHTRAQAEDALEAIASSGRRCLPSPIWEPLEGIFAQIAADAVGVGVDRVRVITGDTAITPYDGGTWASRGAGIGGEAVLQSGKALRAG